jgi:hypothetical protein
MAMRKGEGGNPEMQEGGGAATLCHVPGEAGDGGAATLCCVQVASRGKV